MNDKETRGIVKRLIIGICVLGLLLLAVFIFALATFINETRSYSLLEEPIAATKQQDDVLSLINGYRAVNDLPALKLNEKLNLSAQLKADEMKKLGYWSHDNPQGETPWRHFKLVGYNYYKAGENLAKCYTDNVTMVQAWIDSPKHKEVMLGDYSDLGIGTVDIEGCEYVVTHYGKL